MKVYITKDRPYEFARTGADSFKIYSHKPEFSWGGHNDFLYGHEITMPGWNRETLMSGRDFRKLTKGTDIAKDIWEAVKDSYSLPRFSQETGQELDLYEQIYDYEFRLEVTEAKKKGRRQQGWSEPINKELKEKLDYFRWRRIIKLEGMLLEKPGMRWWEWIYGCDLVLDLKEKE